MDLISGTATIELAALNPPFTGAPLMTNKGSASLNDDTPLMETFALAAAFGGAIDAVGSVVITLAVCFGIFVVIMTALRDR